MKKLTHISTRALMLMLRDTERIAGADSVSARLLRRELERRAVKPKRKGVRYE